MSDAITKVWIRSCEPAVSLSYFFSRVAHLFSRERAVGGAEGAADNLEQTRPRAEPHSGSTSPPELKSKGGSSTDGASQVPQTLSLKVYLEHASRPTAFSHCVHQPRSNLGAHISHQDDCSARPNSSLCPAPAPAVHSQPKSRGSC